MNIAAWIPDLFMERFEVGSWIASPGYRRSPRARAGTADSDGSAPDTGLVSSQRTRRRARDAEFEHDGDRPDGVHLDLARYEYATAPECR